MNHVNLKSLLFTGGIGSVVLGLPYIYQVFGPQESDVSLWGYVSFYIGLVSIVLTLFVSRIDSKLIKFNFGIIFSLMAAIQVPPIAAWLLLYGHLSLTDTPLQGTFRVHWVFAIPHIIILASSVVIVAKLFYIKTPIDSN